MTNLVRCPACRGRKIIMGAGMIMKDCHHCSAVGWINKVENTEDETLIEPEPLKRGRKKKIAEFEHDAATV